MGKSFEIVGETSREFDIITRTKFVECKNINWVQLPVKRIRDVQGTFVQQAKIARAHGAIFEVHSSTPISEWFRSWFAEKGIKFIEGGL